MLTIYHVPGTRSVRVIWLCEELGLPYEAKTIDFSAEYRFSDEWLARNPVGKVPVMTDDELSLFESGAMVQYILARYGNGRLQPSPDSADHAAFLQWCWFAEATFARPLGEIVNHGRAFPGEARIAPVVAEMQDRAWRCVEALEQHLNQREFMVGESFTAADIMMGYSVMLVERLIDRPIPPALQRYWQTLQARPALQATLAV